jgi:hypothetical protein
MLVMLVAGIGLAQAVSDPRQVTLRWLRLGGLVALGLLATADAVTSLTEGWRWGRQVIFGLLALPVVGQLLAVQVGLRRTQRWLAAGTWIVGSAVVAALLLRAIAQQQVGQALGQFSPSPSMVLACVAAAALAAGLLGGTLMTMLLGHAYLTAGGEMTQAPFRRLVIVLALLLLGRAVQSVAAGLLPWWQTMAAPHAGFQGMGGLMHPQAMWDLTLLAARYLVGLVVPAVFLYMTWDCVRRRGNQSATGILYVAFVLLIIGEGAALALLRSLPGPF